MEIKGKILQVVLDEETNKNLKIYAIQNNFSNIKDAGAHILKEKLKGGINKQ